MNYLPIDVNNIDYRPDRFATTIESKQLIFQVAWNPQAKSFFVDIYDIESNPILQGRKIAYGTDMLGNVIDDNLPDIRIIPLDPSGEEDLNGITFDNFMREVKPWIVGDD